MVSTNGYVLAKQKQQSEQLEEREKKKKDTQKGISQPLKAVKRVRQLVLCCPPPARKSLFLLVCGAVEIFNRE